MSAQAEPSLCKDSKRLMAAPVETILHHHNQAIVGQESKGNPDYALLGLCLTVPQPSLQLSPAQTWLDNNPLFQVSEHIWHL